MRGKLFLLTAILLCLTALSKSADLPRGVVIDKVACLENEQQSYALYLPSGYTPEKKWPVLYAFDPSGAGKRAVTVFNEAAETFGFIIVSSNNAQNGLGTQKQSEIIAAFWKDTHARFSIDEKKTYAAGLSGGARLANNFAYTCRCIAGVISSGAGFQAGLEPKQPLPFVFFGTAGIDDFNYPELMQLDETLQSLSTPHRIETFDGGHRWLTKELTFEAFEWLNLQAMKQGTAAVDKAFVQNIFSREEKKAETFLQNGKLLEAARIYRSMAGDFSGLLDVKNIDAKLSRLTEQKEYKAALKEEKDLFARQRETAKSIVQMGEALLDKNKNKKVLEKLQDEIGRLREMADAKEDSGERRFARRTSFGIFVETYESAMYVYLPQKNYKTAAANLEMASLFNPKGINIQLELARVLARDARGEEAVEALGRAAENGFKDCGVLAKDDAFLSLQSNKNFQKLKEKLNCGK